MRSAAGVGMLVVLLGSCGREEHAGTKEFCRQLCEDLVTQERDKVLSLMEANASRDAAVAFMIDLNARLRAVKNSSFTWESIQPSADGNETVCAFTQHMRLDPPGVSSQLGTDTGFIVYAVTLVRAGESWKVSSFSAQFTMKEASLQ